MKRAWSFVAVIKLALNTLRPAGKSKLTTQIFVNENMQHNRRWQPEGTGQTYREMKMTLARLEGWEDSVHRRFLDVIHFRKTRELITRRFCPHFTWNSTNATGRPPLICILIFRYPGNLQSIRNACAHHKTTRCLQIGRVLPGKQGPWSDLLCSRSKWKAHVAHVAYIQ